MVLEEVRDPVILTAVTLAGAELNQGQSRVRHDWGGQGLAVGWGSVTLADDTHRIKGSMGRLAVGQQDS